MRISNRSLRRQAIIYRENLNLPPMGYLTGMGSVLNLRGDYFGDTIPENGPERDKRAIASDWQTVGDDIRQVLRALEK